MIRSICIGMTLFLGTLAFGAPPTDEMLAKVRQAAPAKAPAEPAKARKMLIFNRPAGFRHSSIETGTAAMKILGEKSGAFTADATDDPAAFTAEKLGQYDAICLLNVTGNFLETDEQKRAMIDFVKSGRGIVGIHSATDAFYDWAEYGQMMGGYFDGHPWNANDTVTLKIDHPSHPIAAAFAGKPFTVTDEIYQFRPEPYSRSALRVLTSLDTSRTNMQRPGLKRGKDGDYAVSWVRNFGQGRVFYCSLGHREDIYWNPTVMAHYLAGIQFALGDLKADATPSSAAAALSDDDRLDEAEKALDAGDKAKAAAIYRELFAAEKPEHVRTAALRGLVASSDDGVRLLVEQLSAGDARMSITAARMLQEVRDPAATAAIVKSLGAAAPPVQAVLADVLARRGDRAAAPALAKLAAGPEGPGKLAAVKALGRTGGAEEVELLVSTAAAGRGELRDAARASLASLRGPQVNEKLLAGLSAAKADEAVERVRALGERQAQEVVPQLIDLAGSKSEPVVRREAFRVLGELAQEANLPELLALLAKESDAGVAAAAEKAVIRVASRQADAQEAVEHVLTASNLFQGTGRATLLRLLGGLGGPRALAAVRGDLKSSDPAARDAAARALANWSTADAAPDLLDIAKASEGTTRILALRGYIRLARLVADPAARVQMYRHAMELSQRPDEKRLVLAGLADTPTRDAIEVARTVETDPALKAEAEQAIARIQQSLQ